MKHLHLALAAALVAGAVPAHAGPYGDDLARCLVASSSDKDRSNLIRWVFTTTSLHPDLADISSVTAAQRTEISRTGAQVFERLLTSACRKQTRDALKNEGATAMQQSFNVLGQVAMGSMMGNPAVAAGFADLGKHVDPKKFEDLMKSAD